MQQHPFVGTWTANLAMSTLLPANRVHRSTVEFTVAGDTLTMTNVAVRIPGGEEERPTTTLKTDGYEYQSDQSTMTVMARWVRSDVLETVAKMGDQVVAQGIYEVSADGNTLTVTSVTKDATGADVEQVAVYDRR